MVNASDLLSNVLEVKHPSKAFSRFANNKAHGLDFTYETQPFEGSGGSAREQPVVDAWGAVVLLMNVNMKKRNAIKQQYTEWVLVAMRPSWLGSERTLHRQRMRRRGISWRLRS
jgi:hypothetical protein